MITILAGDCREQMRALADNSIDAIVCDPPYELGFMGKKWDATGIAYDLDVWKEALRVLKPGGHLLAFSGTRTYHRMAVAIEDAGFEVRDMIAWHYGSGFPKSLDVSKAIDKAAGAEREIVGTNPNHRPVSGVAYEGVYAGGNTGAATITAPATDAAREWEGWGTALKPATEPICVGRKPLGEKTVAANVLRWGTGALNIDGCRVKHNETLAVPLADPANRRGVVGQAWQATGGAEKNHAAQRASIERTNTLGRWPANLAHDGSDEIVEQFPAQAGAAAPVHRRNADKFRNSYGAFKGNVDEAGSTFQDDSGSAARFFYCAKASRSERGEFNDHPTVKPVKLMRWLVRLVTPPCGIVLDPFMGSGSTALAAIAEGFGFVGCEQSADYVSIVERRLGLDLA
jgi:hypothetical protein